MTMGWSLWWWLTWWLRPLVKWLLRRTTGLCELQRICYGQVSGAPRVKGVERSLERSRNPQLRQMVAHLDDIAARRRFTGANERQILERAVSTVLLVKRINPAVHPRFGAAFGRCVEQIWGYRQLVAEVEQLRQTAFNSEDAGHEQRLLALWQSLRPQEPLQGRISKQWQDIGFQGDDPKTDFRGMGLLGLENLLFFAGEFRAPAQHVLAHSMHPSAGYCFAIVGINITHMAWTMLRDGSAQTYFYNASRSLPTMRLFHSFYSYLFYEFDRFWAQARPSNIMEFAQVRGRFERQLRAALRDPRAQFKVALTVDHV